MKQAKIAIFLRINIRNDNIDKEFELQLGFDFKAIRQQFLSILWYKLPVQLIRKVSFTEVDLKLRVKLSQSFKYYFIDMNVCDTLN